MNNPISTIVSLLLLASAQQAFSQQWDPPTGPTSDLCPSTAYRYETSGCDGIFWGVDHGTITSSGTDSDGTQWVVVKFSNVSTGAVSYSCAGMSGNGVDVTIHNNPIPVINGSSALNICGSGTTVLTANATANTKEYKWTLPTGFSAPTTTTLPQNTITFDATHNGPVTVRSVNDCSPVGIALLSDPSSPVTFTHTTLSSPTVSKNSTNYAICSGESWTLTCASPQGTTFGYDWYISYNTSGSGVLLNGGTYTSTSVLHTGTNTVALTAPSGYGRFFAQVRLSSASSCVSNYVHFESRAGVYNSSEFSISGPSAMCRNSVNSFSATYSAPDILDHKWGWGSSFNYQSGQGTNWLNVSTTSSFSGAPIVLQLKNRCGYTGSPAVKYVAYSGCGFLMMITPNPSSDALTLSVDSDDSSITNSDEFDHPIQLTITNSSNLPVWSGIMDKNKFSIDVSALPNGIYFVNLADGKNSRTQRIQISH